MPYDLSNPLVIGISSRALFDLEEENRIFEQQGLTAYAEYQNANEEKILQPGAGFELIKAFLRLNQYDTSHRLVEVIIMSRNSPDIEKRYGIHLSGHPVVCTYSPCNPQCLGNRCPYHTAADGEQSRKTTV